MVIFVIGLLVTGLLGTSTTMTFAWPGYLLLGAAGVGAMGLLFTKVTFAVPRITLLLALVALGYLAIRATDSPITYLARADVALALSGLMAYTAFLTVAPRWDLRLSVILTLAVLVLAHLAASAWQVWVEPSFSLVPGYVRNGGEGIGGMFQGSDSFAGFLAILVPLWIALAAVGRWSGKIRLSWTVLALISAAAVVASGSALGLLTMLTGIAALGLLLIWIAWRCIPQRGRSSLIGGLAGCALLLVITGIWQHQRVASLATRTLLVRTDGTSLPLLWKAGLQQFAESPLIGTGSRTSSLYGTRFRSPSLASGAENSGFIENEVVQVLADYGLAGLGLFALVLACHLGIGLRFAAAYARSDLRASGWLPRSQHLALVIGALAALSGLLMLGMFSAAWHLPIVVMTAAVLLAVLAAPDPMATILHDEKPYALPGGGALFLTRAVTFAGGLALLVCGQAFVRSEYHLEQARLLIEGKRETFQVFRHLHEARDRDQKNPLIYALSGHLHFASVSAEMEEIARREALEKSAHYFEQALRLHAHDPSAILGQVAALEALGESDQSALRLADAKVWAPLSGRVRLAEAEHHLRRGEILLAEKAYQSAMDAPTDRVETPARLGLDSLARWRDVARSEGWTIPGGETVRRAPQVVDQQASDVASRTAASELPEADVTAKTLSGPAGTPAPTAPPLHQKADSPTDRP
jgi:hypothetical protein